jgi:tRNA-dihydrouridine synthase A
VRLITTLTCWQNGSTWNLDLPDRFEIIDQMLPYIAKRMQEGAPLSIITRHILGLFQNLPGARKWRQALSGGNSFCRC